MTIFGGENESEVWGGMDGGMGVGWGEGEVGARVF